ncbi:hypothetical protein FACS189445_4730 [Spirochaetia bacterium]|nr:hypothetical protein FACS189445_4730 [Spirochaetia bacterium]
MSNTTAAEKLILREILSTGNLNNYDESFFQETAHKFIICGIRHVMRDKKPITLNSVCAVLPEFGMEEVAQELRGIVGGSI